MDDGVFEGIGLVGRLLGFICETASSLFELLADVLFWHRNERRE